MIGDTIGETVFLGAVLGSIGLTIFAIFFGLLYKGVDRKLVARMQMRVGPPLRQPFRDVVKLMGKETIVPENAIGWMYAGAPLIALASAIVILLYIPLGSYEPILSGHGDVILVLYLFMLPALAMVAGGFASGSPFATIGAQREMITMMSYEFPLAVVVISLVFRLKEAFGPGTPVFDLAFIAGNPIWDNVGWLGLIGAAILLFAMVIVTPGKVAKIPFDVAEAETELAEGLLAEYSGRNLALFYLADAVRMFAVAAFVVALFFPYALSPVVSEYATLGEAPAAVVDFLFFLLKVLLVMFFSITVARTMMARLRITQVVSVYWVTVTLIALFGLVLVMWDAQPGVV
jgi:formate hydrogenlyase subunit 4